MCLGCFWRLCSTTNPCSQFFVSTTGVNVAEHDWHHENFLTNYSLSFKYLDKVFGTYHPGRVPGEQKMTAAKAE